MSNPASVSPAQPGPALPARRRGRRTVWILALVLALIAALLAGGSLAYASQYDGKALPGTSVLGTDVAGKTPAQIAALVSDRAAAAKVTVRADGTTRTVSLAEAGVAVDAKATAARATDHPGGVSQVLGSTFSGDRAVQPVIRMDATKAKSLAASLLPDAATRSTDASVRYDEDSRSWEVTPGHKGKGIDSEALAAAIARKAPALNSFTIDQPVSEVEPALTADDAHKAIDKATAMLDQKMTITGPKDATHKVSSKRRSGWVSIVPDAEGTAFTLSVDRKAVRTWVAEQASKDAVPAADEIQQVDAHGTVIRTIAQKKDGQTVSNIDAVTDQLVHALQSGTELTASFETKPSTGKTTQVLAPTSPEASEAAARTNPTGEKWVDVDLKAKTVTAYVGRTPVWGPHKIVDGKPGHETTEGTFHIYMRYDQQDMTNASKVSADAHDYYYTKDVPWVQYFNGGIAFHGAPWRSSFGYSGSHGCINMRVSEAKWLYDWASEGTTVVVHR